MTRRSASHASKSATFFSSTLPAITKLTTEKESEALPEVNRIVRDTEAVRDAERANVAYAQGENHFVVAHPMPTGGAKRIRV